MLKTMRKQFPCWILIAGCLIHAPRVGSAASGEQRTFEADLLFPRSAAGALPQATTVVPEISPPLEAPLDAGSYRLIPGDLLQLEVGGESDRAWRLAVTAEGTLLLPGAEAIDVASSTLAETAERVRQAMAHRYPRQPVSLHLLQPGAFRVPVTGQVLNPGVQNLRAYDRLSVAIAAAGGPLPGASLRHVAVTRPDGSEEEFDLVRFASFGELDSNPFLEPGMSIHLRTASDFVRVTGAVRGIPAVDRIIVPNVGSRIPEQPDILLEWMDGETIGSAVARAGGLSPDSDGSILLVRGAERRMIAAVEADAVTLLPGDVVEAAMRDRWVFVVGAVRYPGPYSHLPTLTASDYVRLAGGPTEIGRGSGWKLREPGSEESRKVGGESYVPPGSTVIVPERWTYKTSTLLAPISGITALVISVIALRQ